ncbi:MAG: serine/threonine-protein kinase [Planctomycetaceae bacterium]
MSTDQVIRKTECLSRTQLREFLENADGLSSSSAIARHVNRCAECQQILEELIVEDEHLSRPGAVRSLQDDVPPWMSDILAFVASRPAPTCSATHTETVPTGEAAPLVFPDVSERTDSLGRLDEFEILEKIASGGTGHLYRALDTRLNRPVAVKVLRGELCVSETARRRFLQEARAIARLTSDHVVSVFDARERHDYPPYLVMEFVEGESLQQKLDSGFRPTHRQAVSIIIQVLTGIQAAHQSGVIHRDVKPANLLVTNADGRIKLVDFGLARLEADSICLTSPGVLAGTPAYIAPEQILDAHAASPVSDVYSSAIVLYELLTGELPFQGSVRMVLHQALHEELRSLRSLDDTIPRDLQTVCLKAAARLPAMRYPSAVEFLNDLQRWKDGLPVLARPVGWPGRFLRWQARNPVAANLSAVITALIVTLIALGFWYTLQLRQARNTLSEFNMDLQASNQQLQNANSEILAERERAIHHAVAADHQANLAYRVLTRLTFEVQDALAGQPRLQERILQASISDLQQLASEVSPDSPVGLTLITATIRLAERLLASDRIAESEACLKVAEDRLQSLSESLADDPDAKQCRIWLALCRGDLQSRTDQQAGIRLYSEVVRACETLEQSGSAPAVTLHSHAVALLRLADAGSVSATDEPHRAGNLQFVDLSLELLERCRIMEPLSDEFLFDLASARLKRANLLSSDEDLAREIQTAVDLMMEISDESPLQTSAIFQTTSALVHLKQLASHDGSYLQKAVIELTQRVEHLSGRQKFTEAQLKALRDNLARISD